MTDQEVQKATDALIAGLAHEILDDVVQAQAIPELRSRDPELREDAQERQARKLARAETSLIGLVRLIVQDELAKHAAHPCPACGMRHAPGKNS